VPVGGQSVGVGGPKGGIGHTGHIVSAPYARENPSPSLKPPLPESLGSGGWPGVASKWPVGRGGEASRLKASIGRWGRGGA
jgi:hypothetical protein